MAYKQLKRREKREEIKLTKNQETSSKYFSLTKSLSWTYIRSKRPNKKSHLLNKKGKVCDIVSKVFRSRSFSNTRKDS